MSRPLLNSNKLIVTMKHIFTVLILVLLSSCNSNQEERKAMSGDNYFYVGTYTAGESEGIYKYKLSEDGKLDSIGLVAKSDNPSFLTLSSDKQYLIACNEINSVNGKGTVESFKIADDSLEFLSKRSSGGAHSCFVNIGDKGNVLVANYTGGNVGLLKLDGDGSLSELLYVQQHIGKAISKRQDKAHAHSAWFVPNTNEVISVDLGTNQLWFSVIDDERSKLMPSKNKALSFDKGAGPRHLAIHPKGWIYVVNELNSTVSLVVKNKNDNYELKVSISTLPKDFEGESFCGDIHLSIDSKFLYVSNRGHNSIAVFSVNQENGRLTSTYFHDVKGDWPRNFTLSSDGKFLLVANQKSNNIVSFAINKENGMLTFVDEVNAPTPVCLVF